MLKYGIAVAIVVISSILIFYFLFPPSSPFQPDPNTFYFNAAIVDQLSLTCPNPTFKENATAILTQAGFTVDYYPGEQINVEFYRNLATHNYGIIILRSHSSATEVGGAECPVALFTNERVSQKYPLEQFDGRILGVAYSDEERQQGIAYFGIAPSFVTGSMKGGFQNTIIIMMGCEGLDNPQMASAFVYKGAQVYVSWDKTVTATHTDTATLRLLYHFLTERQIVREAVQSTNQEVGADPASKAVLIYYPAEAGDHKIKTNQD